MIADTTVSDVDEENFIQGSRKRQWSVCRDASVRRLRLITVTDFAQQISSGFQMFCGSSEPLGQVKSALVFIRSQEIPCSLQPQAYSLSLCQPVFLHLIPQGALADVE